MTSGQQSRGTVLVVDDDEILSELLTTVLGRAEFNTVSAVDAAEALTLMGQHDDICAAVCDLELGRDNGAELLRTLRELKPSITCILMSGHTDSLVSSELRDGVVFFQKPFSAATLVRAVIDGR